MPRDEETIEALVGALSQLLLVCDPERHPAPFRRALRTLYGVDEDAAEGVAETILAPGKGPP